MTVLAYSSPVTDWAAGTYVLASGTKRIGQVDVNGLAEVYDELRRPPDQRCISGRLVITVHDYDGLAWLHGWTRPFGERREVTIRDNCLDKWVKILGFITKYTPVSRTFVITINDARLLNEPTVARSAL